MNFLDKLKQPRVIALIAMIIVQLGTRYGYNFDDAQVQNDVLTTLDWLTWAIGLWVAHKSDENSII